jgi:hypothetical protein
MKGGKHGKEKRESSSKEGGGRGERGHSKTK